MASKGAAKIVSKNTKSTEIKFVKALNAHGAVADSSKRWVVAAILRKY